MEDRKSAYLSTPKGFEEAVCQFKKSQDEIYSAVSRVTLNVKLAELGLLGGSIEWSSDYARGYREKIDEFMEKQDAVKQMEAVNEQLKSGSKQVLPSLALYVKNLESFLQNLAETLNTDKTGRNEALGASKIQEALKGMQGMKACASDIVRIKSALEKSKTPFGMPDFTPPKKGWFSFWKRSNKAQESKGFSGVHDNEFAVAPSAK